MRDVTETEKVQVSALTVWLCLNSTCTTYGEIYYLVDKPIINHSTADLLK